VFLVIGLDIQDNMGRHEVGFVEDVERLPIEDGQGCRFRAKFKINKVCHILLIADVPNAIMSMSYCFH
jgi:hypothetical protein